MTQPRASWTRSDPRSGSRGDGHHQRLEHYAESIDDEAKLAAERSLTDDGDPRQPGMARPSDPPGATGLDEESSSASQALRVGGAPRQARAGTSRATRKDLSVRPRTSGPGVHD
jgi:hypothetical protein